MTGNSNNFKTDDAVERLSFETRYLGSFSNKCTLAVTEAQPLSVDLVLTYVNKPNMKQALHCLPNFAGQIIACFIFTYFGMFYQLIFAEGSTFS